MPSMNRILISIKEIKNTSPDYWNITYYISYYEDNVIMGSHYDGLPTLIIQQVQRYASVPLEKFSNILTFFKHTSFENLY